MQNLGVSKIFAVQAVQNVKYQARLPVPIAGGVVASSRGFIKGTSLREKSPQE